MGKLILATVLIVGGLLVGRVLVSMAAQIRDAARPRLPLAAIGRAVQGGGVFLGLLIIVLSSFVVVDSGHIGVVTVFGNVEKVPLYNGLHFVLPYKDVIRMDTRVQKHEARYDAASVDIQAVHAVMALNYRLIDDRAPEVYRTVGLRYEQSIIDPAAAEVLKANTAVHAANDILQQRPRIKADVQDGLTKWLLKYGIQVTEVSIKDIRFDKDFEQAVERKQIAQQVAEQKRYEVDQAKREAESKVARERGEGAALQARAEGEAAALRLRAAAEAEYNAKVTQSLTATLIQQQYLSKWDGKLPQFVTGSGSNLLMQIPTPAVAESRIRQTLLLALGLADHVRADRFHVLRLQVLREREHAVLDQGAAQHDRGVAGAPRSRRRRLEVPDVLAGVRAQRNDRRQEEIVALTVAPHLVVPRTAAADADGEKIERRSWIRLIVSYPMIRSLAIRTAAIPWRTVAPSLA